MARTRQSLQSVCSLEPPRRVLNKIFAELAAKGGKPERIMIDATHLKSAPHGCKPFKKGPVPPDVSGATKGGLNSKLHAVCDSRGNLPLVMLLSEGADE